MKLEQLYEIFLNSTGITTDTRSIKKDNIFVALKGVTFNGNSFAKKAFESGAKFVLIDEERVQNK